MSDIFTDFITGGEEDHAENQIEENQKLLEEKEQEIKELEGVDSPAAAQRRLELKAEITELKISMEQIKEKGAERGRGYDLFED